MANYVSECCGRAIRGEIMEEGTEDAIGMCSCCGEWMGVEDLDAEEDETA